MLFTKIIELHRPGACGRSKVRGHACEAAADGRGCRKCGGACDSGQLPLTEGARADVNSDVMLRGLVSGREEACVMHGWMDGGQVHILQRAFSSRVKHRYLKEAKFRCCLAPRVERNTSMPRCEMKFPEAKPQ